MEEDINKISLMGIMNLNDKIKTDGRFTASSLLAYTVLL